ncbi:uncharacterized protein LOC127243581 [Andrographis paniculata]|uniref:uncharacterized protein LOC127243581 n=1 Tax=Andrographis paniculata TaxID=175694 RepID=UPI0021E6E7EB|nr:uncharacterized protein LOC127243581 [Andrographis paniculata]
MNKEAMDWFSWLSRTDLNPALVYQYTLMFNHNELVQEDIPYFSHEFLQSMGVKVAKHRLEILKLAREENGGGGRNVRLILWLVLAIKQARKYLARHVRALVHREKSSALSVVPPRNHSLRWKVAMVQRNKRLRASESPMTRSGSPLSVPSHGMLMLTEGSHVGDSRNSDSTQSLTWVETEGNVEPGFVRKDVLTNLASNSSFSSSVIHSLDGEYWSEEIKWDAMFQDMKPT